MAAGERNASTPGAATAAGPIGRFEFATAGRVIFGVGTSAELPALAMGLGRRILVVTGSDPGRHAALLESLRAAAEVCETFCVSGEPTVDLAEAGAERARALGVSVVVALGGGSALDAGKAIAALAVNPSPALNYLEVVGRGQPLPHGALPCIAVPTTAGTGAEVTRNAVLAVPHAQVKVSLRHAAMMPRIAVVDPALAVGLPAAVTATTGMDALTQLIEAFLCCRANPFVDALCRDGIGHVAGALPRACQQPDDLAARSDLALGAFYSGIALANAGLGAVHGFAAPIGGGFPAPHGAVCAALLPHVLRTNLGAMRGREPAHPALGRMAELGRLLTGRTDAGADDAVAACADLAGRLGIPALRQWGLDTPAIPDLVEKAAAASSMKANPLPLTREELAGILRDALASGP